MNYTETLLLSLETNRYQRIVLNVYNWYGEAGLTDKAAHPTKIFSEKANTVSDRQPVHESTVLSYFGTSPPYPPATATVRWRWLILLELRAISDSTMTMTTTTTTTTPFQDLCAQLPWSVWPHVRALLLYLRQMEPRFPVFLHLFGFSRNGVTQNFLRG